jgi:hypothetical protein
MPINVTVLTLVSIALVEPGLPDAAGFDLGSINEMAPLF